IMKFWNYPTQGTSYHSYNDQRYGSQSANFASTTYNWAGMPNVLNSPNNSVATLMYHCGVSVDMSYGVAQTGGSSAYVVASMSPGQACAEYSYKTYFGYDPATLQGVVRNNYSDASWINLLKGEMDAGRPVQYAGFGQGGGHTWVCDGYDNNNFFHQNWGWGGNSDGFFSLNNLDPTSLGAGGGTGGFNSGQQAVIGIKPLNGGGGGGGGGGTINQGGIQLYAATTVSANPFQSGGSFSVYTDIANTGSTNFTGDFAAAVFDNNGVFIQFIQEFTGETAQAGYHYNVTFTTNQLQLIPGTYYIGIYYKNGSNNYSLINQSTFYNPVTITVTGPYSDIQMTGNTSTTPATIVKGQSVNIATNMANVGGSAFNGWLSADVFTLEGDYVATLEEFQATLNAQNNYNVNFVNNSVNINPGTYLLAFFSTTDQQNYALVYGQSYPNPVEITIVEPGLSPDQYENNNTEGSPYTFSPSFGGNNASVLTTGSNMHVGNDYDYYTVNLPGGTNYAITARVQDSYSTNNGQTYTNDVQFSYKVNGGSWSNTYDDVMGSAIVVQGGGTVTFFVADYFQGTTGSYLLDLQIVRGANVGINEVNKNNISVFPNPTHGNLYIDAADATGNYDLRIYNILGEQVSGQNGTFAADLIKTDVSALVPGVYTLQLKTGNGISSSKFIVK
ncbi:MAG TPA: C10 family peptidase, partial [Chitinophagales bacterium]|nr:C10 family peptidase [Chitinophagales bacterium]